MPSGAKKRRAAKRKKKAKASKNNISSPAARPRHGESDGGQFRSPALKDKQNSQQSAVDTEKREGNSSGNESLTIGKKELSSPASNGQHNSQHLPAEAGKSEKNSSANKSLIIERNEKAGKEKEGDTEIDRGSSSKKPHDKSSTPRSSSLDDKSHVVEKKTLVPESVQASESLPEKTTHKGETLAVATSPIVDPVKPVDSLLEVASKANDNTKIQERNDLVVNKNASKDDCSTTSVVVKSAAKENGVKKTISPDKKAKTKEYSADSTYAKCPVCGRSGPEDRVNEPDTLECSDKQPLLASAARPVERSSWKSCCGILELFSGSN